MDGGRREKDTFGGIFIAEIRLLISAIEEPVIMLPSNHTFCIILLDVPR